jgi:hypothetical protein
MTFVGLGSVGDYVMHQLHVPVLVVHGASKAAAAPQAKVSLRSSSSDGGSSSSDGGSRISLTRKKDDRAT